MHQLDRRRFLTAAAVASAAVWACPPAAAGTEHPALAELERRFGARLGVYGVATDTGATVAYRADERFAFCSTFKALAAGAVLHRHSVAHLDTRVGYTEHDLMKSSVITRRHVATGMTIGELCDAAVRFSDGTAGNLLLRVLGGPEQLTAYARSLGDTVTRMDRVEPHVADAVPGDVRDTSSPRALTEDIRALLVGDALGPAERAVLQDLMQRNATRAGMERIRAGLPPDWTVADKTGTGDFGTLNDIAVVWPPHRAPLAMGIMSTKTSKDAAYDPALLAEAARYVVGVIA
ncbi:class A beta-lactamase [Mycolicibacterium litorale]|nr:class A beta-lactamase [Mycolicibacterium litorale]MCV7417439.1 class A beta-lactamase [Mycolicibacterium litorale]